MADYNPEFFGDNGDFDTEDYDKKKKLAQMLGESVDATGDENVDMDMLMKLIEGGDTVGEKDKLPLLSGVETDAEKEGKYGHIDEQAAGDEDLLDGVTNMPRGEPFSPGEPWGLSDSADEEGDKALEDLENHISGGKPKEVTKEKITVKKGDAKKKSPVEGKTAKKYDEPLDLFGDSGKQSKSGDGESFGAQIERESKKPITVPGGFESEPGIEEETFGGLLPRGEGAGALEAAMPVLGAAGKIVGGIAGSKLAGKGLSKMGKLFGGAGEEAASKGGSAAGDIMSKNAQTASKAGPKEGKFFQEYFGQISPKGERANIFVKPGQEVSMPRSNMSREIKRLLEKVSEGKVSAKDLQTNLRNLGLSPEDIASILGNR